MGHSLQVQRGASLNGNGFEMSVPQGLFYPVLNLECTCLGCVSFTMSVHILSLRHVLAVR